MSWLIALAAIVVVAAGAYFFVSRVIRNRGPRLVECPDNHQPAAVRAGALKATLGGGLQLAQCSRWPEKAGCGRECLTQIESSPDGCLVRSKVTAWYADKSCSLCGRPVGHVDWMERKPALLDADGAPHHWQEFEPENLPAVLGSHRPLCFDCYVAETFRRQHPELVIDNPWPTGNK